VICFDLASMWVSHVNLVSQLWGELEDAHLAFILTPPWSSAKPPASTAVIFHLTLSSPFLCLFYSFRLYHFVIRNPFKIPGIHVVYIVHGSSHTSIGAYPHIQASCLIKFDDQICSMFCPVSLHRCYSYIQSHPFLCCNYRDLSSSSQNSAPRPSQYTNRAGHQ